MLYVVICFHFTIFVVLGTTRVFQSSPSFCCDLLSFYYLCRTRNNPCPHTARPQAVVICFHFTIFVVLGTTREICTLWMPCCDLLSFYYLCRTRNNSASFSPRRLSVVICFHFTIFVVLETTP